MADSTLHPSEPLGIDGWVKCSLGDPDVSTIIMGQSPDSATYNTSRVGLPFFQGKADFGLRNPVPRTWCSAPTRVAEAGDILVSVRAPVGDANIAKEKCCIGRGVAALRPGLKAHGEFLFYLLLYRKADLDALGSGAIFRAINKDTLQAFEIDLPSLPEQRAIAGVLAKIQAAVEVQEKIVTALRELKASTMAKLLREGLRGEPLKQTEIGEVSESWEVIALGSTCTRINYGTSVRCGTERKGRPVLRIPNVVRGEIDATELKWAELPEREAAKVALEQGDLLFVRTNGNKEYLGRCAVYNDEPANALFASYLIRVRLDQRVVLSGFVQAYVSSLGKEQITAKAHVASDGKYNIDTGVLRSILVPCALLAEQEAIVKMLGVLNARLRAAKQKLDEAKRLFSSMLHLLMTGQVRVTRRMIALQALEDRRKRRPKWSGKVDEKLLGEIVRRIVEAAAPEKIILFGSAARGEMGPDSDLDLLIVKECEDRRETARIIRRKLIGIGIPIDVIVATPDDIARHKDTIGLIYRPALREGKLVYAA